MLGKSLRFHELQLKWEDSNASPDRRLRSYTMLTAGPNGGSNKDGNLEVAVQYSGPAVLPWLWQPVEQDGETVLLPQAIPHFAGTSGVTLSKWLLAWLCRGARCLMRGRNFLCHAAALRTMSVFCRRDLAGVPNGWR